MSQKPPVNIFYAWVLGTKEKAMRVLTRSLDKLHVGTPRDSEGDKVGNMTGVPGGKVCWPVEPDTHDGVSFVAADCFFAAYNAKLGEVAMLDDADGTLHPGAHTLEVGNNVTIIGSKKRSGKGVVIRTAEYGTDGLDKNVFIPVSPDIIAHHRQPNPPDNSTLVGDPGEGPDNWQGGLHYPLRVRRWLAKFCGNFSTPGEGELFAPLFNMGTNGDGTPAHGASHYDNAEATLSKSGGGPNLPADDNNHLLGETKDAKVHQGAHDIDTLYGPIAKLYGPEEHIDDQWEPGSKGPYIVRVEKRPDFKAKHKNHCGKLVPLVIKWQSWKDTNTYQPKDPTPASEKSDPTPAAEKGDPGPKTGDPPGIQKDPTPAQEKKGDPTPAAEKYSNQRLPAAMQKVIAPLPRPGTTSPGQIETPSVQGHAEPALPDGPTTGRSSPSAYEQAWLNRFGWTEKEFIVQPIGADMSAVPHYKSATPNNNATGAGRWEPVLTQEAIYEADADGRVTSRDKPAVGPVDFVDHPAEVSSAQFFIENKDGLAASPNIIGRIILALKNAAGATIAGFFGIGARLITGGLASGFKAELDFTDSTTEPDIVWSRRNAAGAVAGAGRFIIEAGVDVGDPGNETGKITVAGADYTSPLMVHDIGTGFTATANLHKHSTTAAPFLAFSRSNSDTSSHAVVADDQQLGGIAFLGHDGTDYAIGAYIIASVDGTPGSNDMPTRLEFYVTPDGSQTPGLALTIAQDKVATFAGVLTTQAGRVRKVDTAPATLTNAYHVARMTADITLPATIVTGQHFVVVNEDSSAHDLLRNGNPINGAAADFSVPVGARAEIDGTADGWLVNVSAGDSDLITNAVTAASAFGTDDRMLSSDGTGRGAQSTGISTAGDNLSGVGTLTTGIHTQTIADSTAGARHGTSATTGPFKETYPRRFTTGGAGGTETFLDVPIPTDTQVLLTLTATYRRSSTPDRGGAFKAYIHAKNAGGTVTVINSVTEYDSQDSATVTFSYAASSTNVRISVADDTAAQIINGFVVREFAGA